MYIGRSCLRPFWPTLPLLETRVISGLRPTYGRLGRCPAACTERREIAEWRPERQEEGRQNTCGAAATRGWRPLPGSLQCFEWLASHVARPSLSWLPWVAPRTRMCRMSNARGCCLIILFGSPIHPERSHYRRLDAGPLDSTLAAEGPRPLGVVLPLFSRAHDLDGRCSPFPALRPAF